MVRNFEEAFWVSAACGRSREGGLRGGRVHKVVRRMVVASGLVGVRGFVEAQGAGRR